MPKREQNEWIQLAKDLPEDRARTTVPFRVVTNEALGVAQFFDRYYPEKKRGQEGYGLLPLSSAGKKLPATTGAEIRVLRELSEELHAEHLLSASRLYGDNAALIERAREIRDETNAVLEWHFDDGVEDEKDEQLARVKSEHVSDGSTPIDLANELSDYLTLAQAYRAELDGLGGYDAKVIDEGLELAKKLTELHAEKASEDKLKDVRATRDIRNRVAVLLLQKMQLVRSAARFVYRSNPAIIREVTSPYERRRRAATKRAAAKKAQGGEGGKG